MHRQLVRIFSAVGVAIVMAQAVVATGARETTVQFDPAAATLLEQTYGANETGVLRAAILAALAKQQRHAAIPTGVSLKVTVREVMPTHPTMKQQLDHPSLDPVQTRYLGGAQLVGELLDARQQVLATVTYRNFADVLASGSRSVDPWSDARRAIDSFAAEFAASWSAVEPIQL